MNVWLWWYGTTVWYHTVTNVGLDVLLRCDVNPQKDEEFSLKHSRTFG
jgi:hypothetical protein